MTKFDPLISRWMWMTKRWMTKILGLFGKQIGKNNRKFIEGFIFIYFGVFQCNMNYFTALI